MHFLHGLDAVRGDAKPQIMVMKPGNNSPVLILFERGSSDNSVDPRLVNTKNRDLQDLERIPHNIDSIPTLASGSY